MFIGLFSNASTVSVPAGVDLVQTSGYGQAGVGEARYVYDASVDAAYVAANPRIAFLSANGRGFRLSEDRRDATMFGAVGDYDPFADTGTDSTAAIQAAIDYMAVNGSGFDINPSVLHFAKGYYKITASLVFPTGFFGNTLDFQGSRIYYRGSTDNSAAIFKITNNYFVLNTIRNLQMYCEDRCGYGFYVVGGGNLYATTNNILDQITIRQPAVRAFQLGNFKGGTGYDQDCANWTFRDVRFNLGTGQGGVEIDAPNAFDIYFYNTFFGGFGDSKPDSYLRVLSASGVYLVSVFTGDNGTGIPAIDLQDGNTAIFGWNSEGSYLLRMSGFAGERRNVLVENVIVNDSECSSAATDAIIVEAGHLALTSATLGKTNIHPRNIVCHDTLIATDVYLGSYGETDEAAFGRYILTRPERCTVEGRRLSDVRTINGNGRMDLWTGSAADDLPWGYRKATSAGAAVGACTVTRSTAHVTNGNYTAKIEVTNGGTGGQMCAGLAAQVPIAFTPNLPTEGNDLDTFVAVVRGHAEGLTGTTTVNVRLTFKNQFDNPINSGRSLEVTPDANGDFIAVMYAVPQDVTVTHADICVGLSAGGATGTIWQRDVALFLMNAPTINYGTNYRSVADAWSLDRPQINVAEDYAKVGVTARLFGSQLLRSWFGTAAPTAGSYSRGDEVVMATPSASGPNGWRCVAQGTPGTWKAYGTLEP